MNIAIRRLIHAVIVVFGVITVVFIVTRVVADPARLQLAAEASQQDYEAIQERLGLDGSIAEQYGDYLSGLARFDFGDSFTQNRPAVDVVGEAFPRTIQLVAIALPLTMVLSITFGVLAALKPGGFLDRMVSGISLLGFSVPPFLVGLLLVLVMGVWLKWLPTSGIGGLDNLVLPVSTLALSSTGRLTTMIRSSMIDELDKPWIAVARAKGMPMRRIIGVHALRNASVGVVTLLGLELITMIAGYSVIVEFVFAWPGLGLAALSATSRQDLPVVQMVVLLLAVVVVIVNLLVDAAYSLIDPRIRIH